MVKPSRANEYVPRDQLFLFWLAEPERPVLVGELNMVRSLRGVSLRYAEGWLERGFPLSEDLPLSPGQEFLPREKDTAAGAVDDARPDRWGERVIRFLDKPPRLSLLEYLYLAGDDRFGALGVSTSATDYLPRRFGPLPVLAETEAIFELVRKVLASEPVPPELRRLIVPGVTLGGAKPKALLDIGGEEWIVKFADGHASRRERLDDAGSSGRHPRRPHAGGAAELRARHRHQALRSRSGTAPPRPYCQRGAESSGRGARLPRARPAPAPPRGRCG